MQRILADPALPRVCARRGRSGRASSRGTTALRGCARPREARRAEQDDDARAARIGVDARELLGDPTGVGRYLGELLRRWTTS